MPKILSEVNIRLKGFTKTEEAFLKQHLQNCIGDFVKINYVNNYNDTQILMQYLDNFPPGKAGQTVTISGTQQVNLNRKTIESFDDINRVNAFLNTCLHEIAIHALPVDDDHGTRGLSRGGLRTHKIEWSKFDRKYLRSKLKAGAKFPAKSKPTKKRKKKSRS